MFARDRAVVVDERFDGIGHIDDLRIAIDLHVGAVELVRQHSDARAWITPQVGGLGTPRVTRDHDPALLVDPACHRRTLQRSIRSKRGEHHAMSRSDEFQQPRQIDGVGGRVVSGHTSTLATGQ